LGQKTVIIWGEHQIIIIWDMNCFVVARKAAMETVETHHMLAC